jgi:hypothetical protein
MAKTKYYVPEKEKPHFNKEKGWIEKIEYQIKPYFEFDENNSVKKFVIEIYSFREFAFFRYSIDYQLSKKKNDIYITIKGLNTDGQVFPDSGKASARIEFENLIGNYNFHFRRSSNEENIFQISIDPILKSIEVKKELPDKKTNRKFVEVIT